jgi:hypothetical protein
MINEEKQRLLEKARNLLHLLLKKLVFKIVQQKIGSRNSYLKNPKSKKTFEENS